MADHGYKGGGPFGRIGFGGFNPVWGANLTCLFDSMTCGHPNLALEQPIEFATYSRSGNGQRRTHSPNRSLYLFFR